jgi:hypothetical protein
MIPARIWRSVVFICIVLAMYAHIAHAVGPMLYRYDAPESPLDVRYVYHWEILRTALERTQDTFGPFQMIPSESMTEKRQVYELEHATGKLTVMYLDTTPEHEQNLIPVRIPVDKGLVGYRIFLIRTEDQHTFKNIQSIEDVRKFKFGLHADWIDVDIFRFNKFNVVTGSSYDGLFEMLLHNRFDLFSRGANEIIAEYERRKNMMPGLHIEESLLVCYPAPMYFWFSKNEEGMRLAARAEAGMRAMIEDGTYDRIFLKHYRSAIKRLDLRNRKVLRIKNPFLVPGTPLNETRLWFDPQNCK